MRIRKELVIAILIMCGVIMAVSQSRSADEAKPAAAQDDAPPKVITRVYDARPLVTPEDDQPFETSPHATAFIAPPGFVGQSEQSSSSSYGGGPMLFGNGTRRRDSGADPRAENTDALIKSITDTIDADSWREAGGSLGAIREHDGMLIVDQTESAHKKIAALLRDLSAARNEPVRTTADWLLLPPGDVEKLLKPPADHESGMPREVDPAALQKLPPAVRHFHADMPGHNGQTLHCLSGHEKTVTFSASPVVGTGVAAFSPLLAIVADGVGIQVTPVVDHETSSAIVTVFSTFNADQQNGPMLTLRSIATTQPVNGDPISSSTANASYHEVSSTVQEIRSTLRLPLNVPVIAGAMTLTPTEKGDDRELVLILCVHAKK